MTSKATQIMKKRSIRPKEQYSPSNPMTTTMYHLVAYTDTGNMMIVGNSSVKRLSDDGTITLNDGRIAKLIFSGTKDKCIKQWNKQKNSSKNNNTGDEKDQDDDELPDLMEQTLQMPGNTFSTPAPYRRQKTLVRRSGSPDSIVSLTSPKRFAYNDHSNCSIKRTTNGLSFSQRPNGAPNVVSPTMSSSDEEEVEDTNEKVSLRHLFEELQNTKESIRNTRADNQTIQQQLSHLGKKMSNLSSLILSKTDNDLDRYRDPNCKEDFPTEIIHDGSDLLQVPAKNVGEYARNILKILFKPDELQSSLLPSKQSKRYSKPELDRVRFTRLNAIRARYRITKFYYELFYKERIQETLAACVYNEGTRKQKKREKQQQQQESGNIQSSTPSVEQ